MASENFTVEKPVHNPNGTYPDPISSKTGSGPANFSREIMSGSARSISARAPSSELPLLGWPIKKATLPRSSISDAPKPVNLNSDLKKHHSSNISEIEMMKERFAKFLLGEDMSGSGKGVCTALAISNAITTNLCATIFGQLRRLEPLAMEKKSMWKREMKWLLSVNHIVELMPSWQIKATQ